MVTFEFQTCYSQTVQFCTWLVQNVFLQLILIGKLVTSNWKKIFLWYNFSSILASYFKRQIFIFSFDTPVFLTIILKHSKKISASLFKILPHEKHKKHVCRWKISLLFKIIFHYLKNMKWLFNIIINFCWKHLMQIK